MIRVIALSREHGSGGAEISGRVAARLGWTLVDRWILEEVARRARIPEADAGSYDERVDPWLARLARGFSSGAPDGYAGLGAGTIDADGIAALTRNVVREAAQNGSCVIVGRGAAYLLSGRSDVLRAFVYAPLATRVARLAARGATDPQGEAEGVDRARAAYVRRHFGVEFGARSAFDLLVDSSVGIDRAVAAILGAAGLP